MAVMVEVPAPVKVSVDPLMVATAVSEDEYEKDPGTDDVGAAMVCTASPNVAETLLNVPSTGVAWATVRVIVVEFVVKFTLLVGVKLAVMVEVPAPVKVSVEPLTVATAVSEDEYEKDPGTDDVGAVMVAALSPNVALTLVNVPSTGVAWATVTVIVVEFVV